MKSLLITIESLLIAVQLLIINTWIATYNCENATCNCGIVCWVVRWIVGVDICWRTISCQLSIIFEKLKTSRNCEKNLSNTLSDEISPNSSAQKYNKTNSKRSMKMVPKKFRLIHWIKVISTNFPWWNQWN